MDPISLPSGEGVWVERLRIRNFRSIQNLDLNFTHRLTVLIGSNGAGKTTILDALAFVLQDSHPEQPVFYPSDRRRQSGIVATESLIESVQSGVVIRTRIVDRGILREGDTAGGIGSVKAYYPADRSYDPRFQDLVSWFTTKDAEEARQVRQTRNLDYRDPELQEVRRVVSAMISGAENIRIDPVSNLLIVDQRIGGQVETFEVARLAGGIRTMLAVVADLARMFVTATREHRGQVKLLVLIDEIDLHLHPRWQLEVIRNLLDAFPNGQFIVSTHSQEIIASVPSECVVNLQSEDGNVSAHPIPAVQGATFDRVLEDVMGLPSPRPPEVEARLKTYWQYIDAGSGESAEAVAIRHELDELFRGNEPELVRADLAIRRKRAHGGEGR